MEQPPSESASEQQAVDAIQQPGALLEDLQGVESGAKQQACEHKVWVECCGHEHSKSK